MAAVLIRPDRSRGRLRLVVLQVLVVSLFLTLLARLWYLQVFSGEEYQARAAEQSIRDVVVQPQRGLIVDAMGRSLVANRTSWVVAVDRTVMGRMDADRRRQVLTRVADTVGTSYTDIEKRLVLCGRPDAEAGTCWNGSPFQPIPVVEDVPQEVAVRIAEQAEDYPGVLATAQSVRTYPRPFGINAAGILGYLGPITAEELDEAERHDDETLDGASVVGRAGLERSYDRFLRGVPGHREVAVDSMGRVLGESAEVAPQPGNTLVTSIDAELQGFAERQLRTTMRTARQTVDPVTGRHFEADSGAIVVLDARDASVLAMASAPTYDPGMWVGGITTKQLEALTSKKSGDPLVSRATQGQYAPGSTWKPIMSVAAMNNGYGPDTRLNCSSGLQVGNRWFRNYESAAYGYIDFAAALRLSCDTFFYRIGLDYWKRFGSDETDVDARDPLIEGAKDFGFGRRTGIDLPGEAAGRIPDRQWKLDYWNAMRAKYCAIDQKNSGGKKDFLHLFAHEFCLEGNHYRAGDAVNFSIGQGDTMVTPLQLARAYSAIANGGKLYAPRVATAIVDPDGRVVRRIEPVLQARVDSKKSVLRYVDEALTGTPRTGTLAWKFHGFPLDDIPIRGKTGTAEVHGKQTTSWVATYTKDFVVVMMVTQAGTGSGTSGPAVRAIWEKLYGVEGSEVDPEEAIYPRGHQPKGLPVFASDGDILPPKGTSR